VKIKGGGIGLKGFLGLRKGFGVLGVNRHWMLFALKIFSLYRIQNGRDHMYNQRRVKPKKTPDFTRSHSSCSYQLSRE
jgi:hypothetical protein